jgi:hypothetical protein
VAQEFFEDGITLFTHPSQDESLRNLAIQKSNSFYDDIVEFAISICPLLKGFDPSTYSKGKNRRYESNEIMRASIEKASAALVQDRTNLKAIRDFKTALAIVVQSNDPSQSDDLIIFVLVMLLEAETARLAVIIVNFIKQKEIPTDYVRDYLICRERIINRMRLEKEKEGWIEIEVAISFYGLASIQNYLEDIPFEDFINDSLSTFYRQLKANEIELPHRKHALAFLEENFFYRPPLELDDEEKIAFRGVLGILFARLRLIL